MQWNKMSLMPALTQYCTSNLLTKIVPLPTSHKPNQNWRNMHCSMGAEKSGKVCSFTISPSDLLPQDGKKKHTFPFFPAPCPKQCEHSYTTCFVGVRNLEAAVYCRWYSDGTIHKTCGKTWLQYNPDMSRFPWLFQKLAFSHDIESTYSRPTVHFKHNWMMIGWSKICRFNIMSKCSSSSCAWNVYTIFQWNLSNFALNSAKSALFWSTPDISLVTSVSTTPTNPLGSCPIFNGCKNHPRDHTTCTSESFGFRPSFQMQYVLHICIRVAGVMFGKITNNSAIFLWGYTRVRL